MSRSTAGRGSTAGGWIRSRYGHAAVLSVALLILVAISPLMIGGAGDASAGYMGTEYEVVYHKDYSATKDYSTIDESETILEVHTYGSIISTEYNPQVWDHESKWNAIEKYIVGETIVFTGWRYAVFDGDGTCKLSESHYPGEVLTQAQIDSATRTGVVHIFASWGTLNGYVELNSDSNSINYTFPLSSTDAVSSIYTNIINLNSHTVKFKNNGTINGNGSGYSKNLECTIRNGTIDFGRTAIKTNADLAIDNVKFLGSVGGGNHGYDNSGLYANGHALIIGTGIESIASVDSGATQKSFIQVSGGRGGGGNTDVWGTVDVYGETEKVAVSSFLIIHSGIYSSIIGTNATSGNVDHSVYMSLRNVTVLDTVVGGCAGNGSVKGSVHLFATGVRMPGDSYEEGKLGSDNVIPGGVTLSESSIMTGGSSRGGSVSSTHIYLSGESMVWDIQGGGRAAATSIGTSNVEVSGKALIKHALCGSITDGAKGSANSAVKAVDDVNLMITDSCRVGGVYGAGYDTFYEAIYPTMYGGGDISISIEKNAIVGDVFGGGYRGSIGTPEKPIGSISIHMNGGTVLDSIYGGGSGGVDKICHETDGKYNWSDSASDYTGHSEVYANFISIEMKGGKVCGSIYGGGKSAPLYTEKFGNNTVFNRTNVAMVKCDTIDVIVSGGEVCGSVYGAGKGIEISDAENGRMPTIDAMTSSGEMISIKWVTNYEKLTPRPTAGNNAANYSGYAALFAKSVSMQISGTNVSKDVYGGGAFSVSSVESGTKVALRSGTTVGGDVYGGGLGISGTISSAGDRTVVLNGAVVEGGVYGGSCKGDDGKFYYSTNNKGEISGISASTEYQKNKNLNEDNPLTSSILLISGSVKGGVYGGGFYGTSFMDSKIFFGSPAIREASSEYVLSGASLVVGSMYSGGNIPLSTSGEKAYEKILLMGNAEISIGSGPVGTFGGYSPDRISIVRDVFGSGNYTLIGGSSSIDIENYAQSSAMASIQRANSLCAKNASVDLSGSPDGGIKELSQLHSLNRIDHVRFDGGVVFTLREEASNIGDYTSSIGRNPAKESDYSFDRFIGNRIVLLGGSVLYIMGNGSADANAASGRVSGFTELSNGTEEVYYGAFVQSSIGCDLGTSGFMVRHDDSMRSADVSIQGDVVLWYVSGHSSLDRVMTFKQNGTTFGTGFDISLPKIASSSSFLLVGIDLASRTNDGLHIVKETDYDDFNANITDANGLTGDGAKAIGRSVFFDLGISGSEGGAVAGFTHVYSDMAWTSSTMSGSASPLILGGSNPRISVHSDFLSHSYLGSKTIDGNSYVLGATGDVGTVIIRLAEVAKVGEVYFPLNMTDLSVTFYIEPPNNDGSTPFVASSVMLVKEANAEADEYTGETSLSFHGSTIRGFTILGMDLYENGKPMTDENKGAIGKFLLFADSSPSGFNGWMESDYRTTGLDLSSVGNDGVFFGKANPKDVDMNLVYTGSKGAAFDVILHVRVTDDSGESYECDAHVSVRHILYVSVNLFYSDINDKTLVPLEIFQEELGGKTVYTLKWGFSSNESAVMNIPYGSSLKSAEFDFVIVSGDSVRCSVYEAIDRMIEKIPDAKIAEEETFNYSDHWVGLYLGRDMLYKFDESSPMTTSATLYAHFGIVVKFDAKGAHQNLKSTIIRPGTSLHDNKLLNLREEPESGSFYIHQLGTDAGKTGYHVDPEKMSWCLENGDEFSFDRSIYADIELHIPWVANTYTVDLVVSGCEGVESEITYGEVFEKETFGTKQIVKSAAGTYLAKEVPVSFAVDGVGTGSISFRLDFAPDYDYDMNKGSTITVKVDLATGYSVNVNFKVINGVSNAIPGGSELKVTLEKGTVSKSVSFSTPSSRDIPVEIRSDETSIDVALSVALSGNFKQWYVAVWYNGALLHPGTEQGLGIDSFGGRVPMGRIADNLVIDGDEEITVCIYQGVTVSHSPDNVNKSTTATAISPDGGEYDNMSFDVKAKETVLFMGFKLHVVPEYNDTNTWALDGIGNQRGVANPVNVEEVTTYTVTGLCDVELHYVEMLVTITLKVAVDGRDWDMYIGKLEGKSLDISINGTSYGGNVFSGEKIQTITIGNVPQAGTYSAMCAMDGFGCESPAPASSKVIELRMVLIDYRIVYFGAYAGGGETQLGESRWNVLMDETYAGIDGGEGHTLVSDGHQVWAEMDGGVLIGLTYEPLSTGMFQGRESMNLYAMPAPSMGPNDQKEYLVLGVSMSFQDGVELCDEYKKDLEGFTASVIVDDGVVLTATIYDGCLTVASSTGGFVMGSGSVSFSDGLRTVTVASLPEAAWSLRDYRNEPSHT